MSQKSKIEWTDSTWNPIRGCDKVSPGCKNCYAETFAERWRGIPGHPFEQGFDLRLVPEALRLPLTWKKPQRIFVNSVSDLFHKGIPDSYIRQVADVMIAADWHTFQVLTKRADREAELLQGMLKDAAAARHIHWGVSVENQKHGKPRIGKLREAAPAVAFLSIEPLLEDLGDLDLRGISWVIVGGESGAGARPMHPDWVRSIRDQCRAAGVPILFKQWGEWAPVGYQSFASKSETLVLYRDQAGTNGVPMTRVGKKKAGRLLDGEEWNQFPTPSAKG